MHKAMAKRILTKRTWFALLITAAGGYMDVYSYLARGEVFATGQTGNFILLGIHLTQGNIDKVFHYSIPILCFGLGVFLTVFLFSAISSENQSDWLRFSMYIEIGTFLLISILPGTIPNIFVNSLISLCASVQLCNFRTIGSSYPFASIFCTGNMRSCAEAFSIGVLQKNRGELQRGVYYLCVLFSFFIGVLLGVIMNSFFGISSSLGISLLLFLASFFLNDYLLYA